MTRIRFKNASLLILSLLLLVNVNNVDTLKLIFIPSDLVETSNKLNHQNEPLETNQSSEKTFDNFEYIFENLNEFINPVSFIISNKHVSVFNLFWVSRSISVLTPPPNFI